MRRFLVLAFAALSLVCSCSGGHRGLAGVSSADSFRGVYFWKTTFALDSVQRSFLSDNKIDRIYLRLFDVDGSKAPGEDAQVNPVGTIRFFQGVPEGVEVVPTVFITVEAIKRSHGQMDTLATRITKRVMDMCSYNKLGLVREVQFDCDWTQSTQDDFFRLCKASKEIFAKEGIILSGTVRLHQIGKEFLPFDRGVLMVYNTGAITEESTANAILDTADVAKYLHPSSVKRFAKYRAKNCPIMDIALPLYGWGVVFRGGEFFRLIHEVDFSDTDFFSRLDCVEDTAVAGAGTRYRVLRQIRVDGAELMPGDVIRQELPSYETIMGAYRMVATAYRSLSGDRCPSTVLYHLDSASISRFSAGQISSFYEGSSL
ncbi:MAG: hypothetical protein MJY67_05035 [Bacteroidales bacterium]|nr:hypothetical protein [Bacteroidales bacterium]